MNIGHEYVVAHRNLMEVIVLFAEDKHNTEEVKVQEWLKKIGCILAVAALHSEIFFAFVFVASPHIIELLWWRWLVVVVERVNDYDHIYIDCGLGGSLVDFDSDMIEIFVICYHHFWNFCCLVH